MPCKKRGPGWGTRYRVGPLKWYCKRTSEESGTISRRKEKELVDKDITMGKHLTI